jgi:hypothetical protein
MLPRIKIPIAVMVRSDIEMETARPAAGTTATTVPTLLADALVIELQRPPEESKI